MNVKPPVIQNEEKTEVVYLHVLRIFAAVLVILLHCISPFYSDLRYFETRTWWICGFLNCLTRTAVPMFFMMSGYLLLKHPKTLDIIPFYKKRLPRLLIPLAVWNVIYYLYFYRANLSVSDFFKQTLVSGTAYHLWFVYSMVGFYLLLPFLKRIVDQCTHGQLWWLLLLLAFTGTIRPFFNTVTPVYIYFFDALANGYLPYFLLGYLLGNGNPSRPKRMLIYGGGLIGVFLCVFGNWYASSPDGLSLIANGGYQLNHMLCASAVFVLFRQLPWEKCKLLVRLAPAWSKRTYGIYYIHVLVLELCVSYLPADMSPMTLILLRFFAVTAISFLAVLLIDKIKPLAKLLM